MCLIIINNGGGVLQKVRIVYKTQIRQNITTVFFGRHLYSYLKVGLKFSLQFFVQ